MADRAAISISTGDSWFENLGGKDIKGHPEDPFRLRVLVPNQDITPRHPAFEYYVDLGVAHIEAVLWHRELPAGMKNFLFVLPERHMSPMEQRLFITRLKTHPQAAQIESVDVITQNPLVVGGLSAANVAKFIFVENVAPGFTDGDYQRSLSASKGKKE